MGIMHIYLYISGHDSAQFFLGYYTVWSAAVQELLGNVLNFFQALLVELRAPQKKLIHIESLNIVVARDHFLILLYLTFVQTLTPPHQIFLAPALNCNLIRYKPRSSMAKTFTSQGSSLHYGKGYLGASVLFNAWDIMELV